jgi:multidrug efflux system membrane fusion protein
MSPNLPPEQGYLTSTREPISRRKKFLWLAAAVAFVAVLTLIVHSRLSHPPAGANFRRAGANALAVGIARVTSGDVPITLDSLGTVTPLATVTVHPQVTGPLTKIAFAEGQVVKAGDLLAVIDPRPFQAALDQASGQLEHDRALLANARVDLERYKTLVAQNSVAEQTYATQQATVLQDEATVTTDQATVETARLNLSYTQVRSPITGSVGLRQVDLGNVVTAYSTSIVVVTQLQPMSVLFTIPEDSLSQVIQRLHGGEKLAAAAYDRTFTTQLDSGVLANTDNEIDTTTGTLKLRAMFNNSRGELFPQQFVNVRLTLETLHDQLLVPGAAVLQGSSGYYVYVVDSGPPDPPATAAGSASPASGTSAAAAAGATGAIVHVRSVVTGPTAGNMISIRSGLQLGETVVVDGADQLRDGAHVLLPSPTPAGGAAAYGSQPEPDGNSGRHSGSGQHPHGRHGGSPPSAGGRSGSPAAPSNSPNGTAAQ